MLNSSKKFYHANGLIIGLVGVTIAIIFYAQVYPTIETYINQLLPQVDSATGAIISLIPLFIAISILLSVIYNIQPNTRYR